MEKLSEEAIYEGNLLIAAFEKAAIIHDFTSSKLLDFHASKDFPGNMRFHSSRSLRYHSSYTWILPVVEKLVDLTRYKKIQITPNSIYVPGVFIEKGKELWVHDSDFILLFWRFAVEFIKYLNENS